MQRAIRQASWSLIEQALTPEQALAAAVIGQAIRDARGARNGDVSERDRTDAQVFLSRCSEMFAFWANVAGLDPQLMLRQAHRFLKQPRDRAVVRRADRPRRGHAPLDAPSPGSF